MSTQLYGSTEPLGISDPVIKIWRNTTIKPYVIVHGIIIYSCYDLSKQLSLLFLFVSVSFNLFLNQSKPLHNLPEKLILEIDTSVFPLLRSLNQYDELDQGF